MSQPAPVVQPDPVVDGMEAVLKAVLLAVVVLVALPLVLPVIVLGLLPMSAATKTRFWIVPRAWLLLVVAGPVLVAVLLVVEGVQLAGWSRSHAGGSAAVLAALVPVAVPWLVGNLAAGVLLLPAAFACRRRRVARQVQDRRIPDVVTQERIESARKHAADLRAAARVGVRLEVATGQVRHVSAHAKTAPWSVGGQPVFGVLARPTVRTLHDRLADRRHVRDWVSPDRRWLQLPDTASAVRALLVAESGSGKTVLLSGLIESALTRGWPVVLIDAKGDPTDADQLAARARAAGASATIRRDWNLCTGGSAQIVEKVMRLLPAPDGANQHYLDEARAVLAAVQGRSPAASTTDLLQRLADPTTHVRDNPDRDLVTAVVEARSGLTAAGRVHRAVHAALRPLEPLLSDSGWSYRHLTHDLTIVPLSPADSAHAKIGDLMLVDLRHALADRLATATRTPLLVVVDEFAQLVGGDTDPGDTAAALFETARSAGVGLVLAAQSTAGISADDTRRARALASGAALILGRSKDPEDVVRYAGTVMRMEASGAAAGEELRSARAQHTWVIPPQDVREAWDGAFWLIQSGAIATFRALPLAPAPAATPALPPAPPLQPGADDNPTGPVGAPEDGALQLLPATRPAPPAARIPRPTGARTRRTPPSTTPPSPAPASAAAAASAPAPAPAEEPITGLEIMVRHLGDQQWLAVAYPATDELILNDVREPLTALFATAQYPPQAQFGAWSDQWHPTHFTRWNADHEPIPTSWSVVLNELVDIARHRYHL